MKEVCRVIILIPCFNEAENIEAVVQNIRAYAKNPDVSAAGLSIDYIIINDCSTDESLEKCAENAFNYLSLPINLGVGGCMQTGYKYALEAGYDIAIQHDGDGQHDPLYFGDVVGPIIQGQADIVIGSRFLAPKSADAFRSTGARRLGIRFLSGLIRLCGGHKIYDATSGYRAVSRQYIEYFAHHYAQDYPEPESILDASLRGARIIEVPVLMHERQGGKSSITGVATLYYMVKVSLYVLLNGFTKTKEKKG